MNQCCNVYWRIYASHDFNVLRNSGRFTYTGMPVKHNAHIYHLFVIRYLVSAWIQATKCIKENTVAKRVPTQILDLIIF